MKSKDDIIQEESTLINQDLNSEVPTDSTIVADGSIETNEESEVQPLKADIPIVVTLLGRTNSVIDIQL